MIAGHTTMTAPTLNWKRSKLSNPDWIEFIASLPGGANYKILGNPANQYWVGYHRPKARRSSYVKLGTTTNMLGAAAIAQRDYDQRSAGSF